jgi:hypothetical protein
MAIHLAVFAQSNYNLKFEENEFSFLETAIGYQILPKSADYYLLGDTTLPALPYKTIHILIPENTEVKNVNVSIKTKEILQDIYLINNPVDKPVSVVSNNNSNISNYSGKVYPDKNLKFETIIKLQGFYIAAFSVCPFVYDTQKRSLELITEMNISFNQSRRTNTESTNSSVRRYDMKDFVKSLIINPEEINTLYSQQITSSITRGTTNDIEYLIITSENLKENFNPLKAWKIRKGVKTEILSTSYIYSNYTGSTNQIKIKKCLQDYYKNKNLKWVLLGGDNTVVPVQGCYGYYGSYMDYTMPCDLFYACFDNTFNWDANNNGIIGETNDDIDMAPEIYISRAPIRTAEHINTFVNKTLEYEINPPTSNYVKTILLTGTKLFNEPNGAGESDAHWKSEQMYLTYISPYWTNAVKTRFYDTGTDFIGGASYDLTATNLQTVLNNGYHFVHMATHGGQTTWSMETGSSYNTTNAQNETNSKKSIIVTIACNTNAFDDALYTSDPCLSEAFIRNPNGGGILYWGSSRYGWRLTSFPFSQRFFQNFFSGGASQDTYKFGAVTAITKSSFISSSLSHSTTHRWLQFSQNSIGDPELSIYTENPITFSGATVSGTQSSKITVNTGGISGCTIALTSSNDYGESYFQVAKNVSSYTFTNVTSACYVTITKHNYVPYLGNVCKTTNFSTPTVNTTQTVTGCNINVQNVTVTNGATLTIKAGGNINVQSVTVKNNSKLILDANGEVNIISDFDVQLGSEFEIVYP